MKLVKNSSASVGCSVRNFVLNVRCSIKDSVLYSISDYVHYYSVYDSVYYSLMDSVHYSIRNYARNIDSLHL